MANLITEISQEKINKTIETTIRQIKEHLANGGSIYDKKDKLKYYRNLMNVKSYLNLADISDAYKVCGFDYKMKKVDKEVTIERLKEEIDAFYNEKKTLNYPEKKKPFYEHIRALKKKLNISSTKEIYKMCGYDYDPVEQAKHTPLTVEIVKKRIDKYVAGGGSIYAPKRDLPYYDSLQQLKDKLKLSSMEEAYEKCGYKFDRDYAKFKEMMILAKKLADKSGSLDYIKLHDKKDNGLNQEEIKQLIKLESYINFNASKMNCSPADYLIYMTDYHYEYSIIRCDYIYQLYEDLLKAYPDKIIKNIKAENISLYHKLKHAAKYTDTSLKQLAEALGFDASIFKSKKSALPSLKIHKNSYVISTLKSIQEAYGEVDLVADKDLYKDALICSIKEGKSLKVWLKDNGIKASNKTLSEYRLSRMKVDYKDRAEQINSIQDEIIKEENLTIPTDERERYYFNLSLAEKTIKKLNDNYEIDISKKPIVTKVKMQNSAYIL